MCRDGGGLFYQRVNRWAPCQELIIVFLQFEVGLRVIANGTGFGIGGGLAISYGNIFIEGGTITATDGQYAAGIGSGNSGRCGNITIGGTVYPDGITTSSYTYPYQP